MSWKFIEAHPTETLYAAHCNTAILLVKHSNAQRKLRVGVLLGLATHLFCERTKLESLQQADQFRVIRLLHPEMGRRPIKRYRGVEPNEFPIQFHLRAVIQKLLPEFCVLELVNLLVEVRQGTEFLQQGCSGLFANAGNTGDVVDRIAPQAQEIDDLAGRHTVTSLHDGSVHLRSLFGSRV